VAIDQEHVIGPLAPAALELLRRDPGDDHRPGEGRYVFGPFATWYGTQARKGWISKFWAAGATLAAVGASRHPAIGGDAYRRARLRQAARD
jgi:hypothetical protein